MAGFRETTLADLAVDHRLEVNTLTGGLSLSVPIRLSPGRQSFGPSLTLTYQAGLGNSPFGLGWTLSGAPAIMRDAARGLPVYRDEADRFLFGAEEIVACGRIQAGRWTPDAAPRGEYTVYRYRSRVDRSFDRFEKWVHQHSGRIHWRRLDPHGVVSVFGLAADTSTCVADPENAATRVFQWLLEAQYDTHGNAIRYAYKSEDTADVDVRASFEARRLRDVRPLPQRYLKYIRYGNTVPRSTANPDAATEWRFEVVFDYGEHGAAAAPPTYDEARVWPARVDPFSTCRPGFDLRTWRVCRRILMFHRFPQLGAEPCLVGATELIQREDPAGTTIDSIGYRGYRRDLVTGAIDERALTPLRLTYSEVQPRTFFEAPLIDHVPVGVDGSTYQWVDLRGEGLSGILSSDGGSWRFTPNLGGGRFGPLDPVYEQPATLSSAFRLDDFDGDGNLNFVGYQGREAGFFARDRTLGRWRGFVPFRSLPRADFANARVQWIDLNGDAHPDLLVDHDDRMIWYPSDGADGFSAARAIAKRETTGAATTLVQDPQVRTFFADMNGDGLADLVRVDDGSVEYWPNLGQGLFGDGVVMEDAPLVGGFGRFDPQRLRLVDLDGSGTADLLYIGDGEIRCWSNQSGNRFGGERRFTNLPYIDNLSSADVLDPLGNGTSCLVWSTPLPTSEGRALQYLQLTGDLPPRLLTGVVNGMGRRTEIAYRSSAEDYLRDRREGRAWKSLLPQHVMVVGRLDSFDLITGGQLTTRYEYHDGTFDDGERRLVGFGLVDSYDAMVGAAGVAADPASPPALTRRWFLTGMPAETLHDRATEFYGGDALAPHLPWPVFESLAGLTTSEQLDGARALGGVAWREEMYAIRPDGTRAAHPLRTSETSYRIRRAQAAHDNDPAVFTFFASEALTYHYEEVPDDPRVQHQFLLAFDGFGNAERSVSISYPRRERPQIRPEQSVTHVELRDASHAAVDEDDRFETGLAVDERRYVIFNVAAPPNGILDRATLLGEIAGALANPIGLYDESGVILGAMLVGFERMLYCAADRATALAVGQVGPVTLLHHLERAVMPDNAVDAAYDGHATAAMMAADGHYRQDDGFWWAEDEAHAYGDAATFFSVESSTTVNGARQTTTYDADYLHVTATQDGLGNWFRSTIDYQVLAAAEIRDPNNNVSDVRYDPLGTQVVSGTRGRQLGADGAEYDVGSSDLAAYVPSAVVTIADVLADPESAVQGMSRFAFHDVAAFARGDGPPATVIVERQEHVNDGEGGGVANSPVTITLSYFDGFGRVLQTKTDAGAGLAIVRGQDGEIVVDAGRPLLADAPRRWLVSGFDVHDTKGWLVRKFEPFFSTSAAFEFDGAVRRYGVSTSYHYDALGRIVRQDLANGSLVTQTHTPWQVEDADGNDTVTGSAYEAARQTLPANDPERQALTQSLAHAGTPATTDVDPLGRTCHVVQRAAAGVRRETTTLFGPLGLPASVVDARGLTAVTYRYDMLGRALFQRSIDAGDRWMLNDSTGRAVHLWDGQGGHTRRYYDAQGRHTSTAVAIAGGGMRVAERAIYGDDPVVARAALRNARGRVVQQLDEAGVVFIDRYHLFGHPLDVRRVVCDRYDDEVDWRVPANVALAADEYRTVSRVDGQDRLIGQDLPDGTTREYVYAAPGHVAEVRVSTADGQLVRQVIANGIVHDARGQRAQLRFGNGVVVDYEYDPQTFRLERLYAHRVAPARDYLDVEYTYDAVGNITRWVDRVQDAGSIRPLIQGLHVTSACEFTYDAFYRLATATGRVHQALLQHDYRGTAAGTLKGTRHLTLNNGAAIERYTRTYTYDLADNIQRIAHRGQTAAWATDMWISPASNRSLPALDLNDVAIANPDAWFDANGNTIRLPHLRAMTWDHANRLVGAVIIDRSADGAPNDSEHYVYGSDGVRVRRVTQRLVDGQLEIADTIYLDGCEIRRVTRGGVTRLLRRTSHISDGGMRLATLHQWTTDVTAVETDDVAVKRLHYLVGNHLGSVSLELDEAGDVISYEEFFPYGGASFIAGDRARDIRLKEYRYTGKLIDDATGLHVFEYRYFAAWLGHWLSPDPIGPADGLNLYCYVHDNPICFVDADGLQTTALQVTEDTTSALPTSIQQQLQASPKLRQQWERNDIFFIPRHGKYVPVDEAGVREFVRNENRAGRIPNVSRLAQAQKSDAAPQSGGGAVSQEQFDQILRDLEDALRPIREMKHPEVPADAGAGLKGKDGAGNDPTAHPADGSSGSGDTKEGKTGESGSNGSTTTGQGPGAAPAATATPAGGGGESDEPVAGSGVGGVNQGGDRGNADRTVVGSEDGDERNAKTPPPVPVPEPPPGYEIGPNGVAYKPDLPPPVTPSIGVPTTDPSQVRSGPTEDQRGQPGTDKGSNARPNGMGWTAARDAHDAGEPKPGRGRGPEESILDRATRWAGYLNFVFDQEQGGERGGIPGGMGLLNLKGAAFQVLYIISSVVSTFLAIKAVIQSISFAALRQGLPRLLTALRSPIATLRSGIGAARNFVNEALQRAWRDFFRVGSSRYGGPLAMLREIFWDRRAYNWIRQWRNRSFWTRPRWFATNNNLYNWEHSITQHFGDTHRWLRPFVNSYLNSFLRLPARFNQVTLNNHLVPKVQFYVGALVANVRAWRFGQWVGQGAAERIYDDPEAAAAMAE